MSRGPYKSYEYDPAVSVPKTTFYNKRKRLNHEAIQEAEPARDRDCNTVGNK